MDFSKNENLILFIIFFIVFCLLALFISFKYALLLILLSVAAVYIIKNDANKHSVRTF